MKKLFLLMCVCAGLCACSSDDDLVGSSSSAIQDGSVAYLTVNLNDVGSATRATDGGFKYGTTAEQKVNNAYFYFYDAQGNYMAKGNAVPTGTSTGESGENDGNIEWTSNTLVAVWGLSGTLPTQMLTVLNQPSSFDGTNKSLAEATAALIEPSYMDSNNGFVMSTSVYEGTNIVNTNTLTADDFYLEPVDLTQTTGVPVYVERLAAKVSVTDAIESTSSESGYPIANNGEFINYPETGVFVTLLGWDVDCVARSEYLSKNIDAYSSWNGFSFNCNGADDYRTYWAESPNYGETHTYPTSNSTFNTDSDEDTKPLDDYLRYVSLKTPVDLGTATYCGENTNTVDVLGDATSTGITNAIVKAQVVDAEGEPIEIVKYHGEYIPLTDFENDMIAEVERYDFSSMIDQVGAAIEGSASGTVANYMHQFIDAIEPVIYCKQVKDADGQTVTDAAYEQFDGRFMEFTNKGDGYVGVWFDTATSVDTDGNAHSNHSDTYPDKKIPDDYRTNVVRAAQESMDNYDFYFKLKTENIEGMGDFIIGLLKQLGFVTTGDEIEFDGSETTGYFLPLNENITITVNEDTNHVYDLRNYLIRVIERESAGIDDDWEQSGYPNLYTDGLMYYSVPIEHLGTSEGDNIVEGQYGIVRNHWYDISITSLANFGHGIADEDEVIVPQVEDDYYYVGAVINILSWKHLTQEVGF